MIAATLVGGIHWLIKLDMKLLDLRSESFRFMKKQPQKRAKGIVMTKYRGILGIFLIGVIALAVVTFVNKKRSVNSDTPNGEETSSDKDKAILEKQHARGEIRQEEYRLKKE